MTLRLISLLLVSSCCAAAGPLGGADSNLGLPFVIYKNPALIAHQEFESFGLSYERIDTGFVSSVALNIPDDNSGFAAALQIDNTDERRYLAHFGFSKKLEKFYLGGAAKFLFLEGNSSPSFTIDAASAFIIDETKALGLVARNLVDFDSLNMRLPITGALSFFGSLSQQHRIGFDVGVEVQTRRWAADSISVGLNLELQKDFFDDPCLNVFAQGGVIRSVDGETDFSVEAGAGLSWSFWTSMCGVFGGYKNENLQNGFYINAYFSPFQAADRIAPTIELKLSTVLLTPEGDGKNDVLYCAVKCQDNKNGTGVKNWTILITSERSNQSEIIRSFSGGGIPPSTIMWDCRNYKGELQKPGVYFIRAFAVDNNNNISQTEWVFCRIEN